MQRYSSCKQSHENMLLMCMIFFPLLLVSYPGMYNYAEVKLHLRSYKNKHRLCFPLPQNPSTWYFINHSHCLSLFFFFVFCLTWHTITVRDCIAYRRQMWPVIVEVCCIHLRGTQAKSFRHEHRDIQTQVWLGLKSEDDIKVGDNLVLGS